MLDNIPIMYQVYELAVLLIAFELCACWFLAHLKWEKLCQNFLLVGITTGKGFSILVKILPQKNIPRYIHIEEGYLKHDDVNLLNSFRESWEQWKKEFQKRIEKLCNWRIRKMFKNIIITTKRSTMQRSVYFPWKPRMSAQTMLHI